MAGKSCYIPAPGMKSPGGEKVEKKDSNYSDPCLRNQAYCEEYDYSGGGAQEESYFPVKSGPAPPIPARAGNQNNGGHAKVKPGVSCYMGPPGS